MKKLLVSVCFLSVLAAATSFAQVFYDGGQGRLYPSKKSGIYCRTPNCDEVFSQSVISRVRRDRVVLLADRADYEAVGIENITKYVDEITMLVEQAVAGQDGDGAIVMQIGLDPMKGPPVVVGREGNVPQSAVTQLYGDINGLTPAQAQIKMLPIQIFFTVKPL